MKIISSDKGGEYYKKYNESRQNLGPFAKFLKRHGICAQYTMLSTLEQNDAVEKQNHILTKIFRSMINHSSLPISLWCLH